ncbi:group II intron reverse transcriptase/maturase [Heliorestis convoluta]|uniref:Group II intron reverse transcriptase/maturase, putative n=1 Tax=Heliorestis convoluta TaxID=356322 RepID=A0A5Q2N345_9FIRM|nr:group II intron reverse transcriptase/maturase [Heliorestis convoluta]QGG46995.1 group II intron reverse transcriptase/maturase, putative [Heliorestis convoluta]
MQKAEVVLSILSEQSKINKDYRFDRLYRNFFNEDFYLHAYKELLNHEKSYKNISLDCSTIKEQIILMKKEGYKTLLKKKNKNTNDDLFINLLLRITNILLRKIYEPLFLKYSYALSQPVHHYTPLKQIKIIGSRKNWVIQGNIDKASVASDHNSLAFLSIKINDGRILELIKSFIATGYRIPVITDIYLYTIDQQINNKCTEKVFYCRYEENLLFLIDSTKKEALEIQEELNRTISNVTKGTWSYQLTNWNDQSFIFLDYEIRKNKLVHSKESNVQLLVPSSKIKEKIKPFTAQGKPRHHNRRINLPTREIVKLYNDEITQLYQYYGLAEDVKKKIRSFRYYHYRSLLKTIARKEKSTVPKIIKKYAFSINEKIDCDQYFYQFVCK